MSEWQDIETAPRDGTWILLGYAGLPTMFSGRWMIVSPYQEGEWVDEAFEPLCNEPPTHWRHLPETPPD